MKKIGLVCLALVMALGMLGVGYARWAEDLFITGTVNTGNIEADWSIDGVGDSEVPLKDVSHVEAFIDGKTLVVTLVNAYPCIDYWVDFDIHCTGSVPIHLGHLVIDDSTLPPGSTLSITPDTYSTQLHTGDRFLGRLLVHLSNEAEESSTYGFRASVEYAQYNEP